MASASLPKSFKSMNLERDGLPGRPALAKVTKRWYDASALALADGGAEVLGQPIGPLTAAVHSLADQIDELLSAQPLHCIPTTKERVEAWYFNVHGRQVRPCTQRCRIEVI